MNNLTILNTSIRKFDNLYSLNDLHRASGCEDKHAPFRFMRNEQTKELIAEINAQTPNLVSSKIIRGGSDLTLRGYWACEELALAYATWISPKFHLVVLRAFIAMHKGEQLQNSAMISPVVEPQPDEEALNLIVRLYHFCAEAQEMREKICVYNNRHIISSIEKDVGGHYLHNLGFPLKNVLDDTKKYIHEKSERIMFIKGMLSLIDEPKRLKA